jgi:uncharacterized protein (DUF2062 family)
MAKNRFIPRGEYVGQFPRKGNRIMKKYLALAALSLASVASAADDLAATGLSAVSGVSAAILPIFGVLIAIAGSFAVYAFIRRALTK